MNFLLNIEDLTIHNILFLETNPNILFDGVFTKINFCNQFLTMYGVYIHIPVESFINLKPKLAANVVSGLNKIESDILNQYIKIKSLGSKTTIVNKIANVLQSKTIFNKTAISEKTICLKISGVWENKNKDVGLSFKI